MTCALPYLTLCYINIVLFLLVLSKEFGKMSSCACMECMYVRYVQFGY